MHPKCPYCGEELSEIDTSKIVFLVHKDDKWEREIDSPDNDLFLCPCCMGSLDVEDLDALGVPNELR